MSKHDLTFLEMMELAAAAAVESRVQVKSKPVRHIHPSQVEHVKRIAELARIRGDDVKVMMGKILTKNPKKSREFLASYADETWRSIQGKHPDDFTNDQVDALGRVLGIEKEVAKDGESDDERQKREEEERKRVRELLAEIYQDDKEHGKKPFSGLLGSYGGGGYVGGTKGGVPDFEKLRDYAAKSSDPARWMKELQTLQTLYEAPLEGDTGREKIGNFMRRFIGQSEWHSANRGPLVAMTMGAEGVPYCGGGMRMIVNRVLGADFYDAKDWRMASSALNVGNHFGAMKQGDPKPGDIVVFPGSGASGCHVGMISRIDEQGNAYYVDFNGGDRVKEAPLKGRTIRGLIDIEVLAQKKTGKTLEQLISDNEQRLKESKRADVRVDGATVAAVGAPPPLPEGASLPQRQPVAALG